jgi:RNA polymerase sigma factor (TIGR02999 family)
MLPTDTDTIIDGPADELVEQLYRELRGLAAGILRRVSAGNVTLQPTALVHEAYERLCRRPDRRWQGRRHFYRAAAQAMRHLLIERARARKAVRHGGAWQRTDISVTLGGPDDAAVLSREELLDLDRALRKLQRAYPALVELVHMRYFCGLTVSEIAELTDVSTRSVEREWEFARAWLCNELKRSPPGV